MISFAGVRHGREPLYLVSAVPKNEVKQLFTTGRQLRHRVEVVQTNLLRRPPYDLQTISCGPPKQAPVLHKPQATFRGRKRHAMFHRKIGSRWRHHPRAQHPRVDLSGHRCRDSFVRVPRGGTCPVHAHSDDRALRHAGSDSRGGSLVRLRDPCAVRLERGRTTAAMTETAGDRPRIDTRSDQFRGGEVPQLVDRRRYAETCRQALVSLSDTVRPEERRVVRRSGKDERVRSQLEA